MTHSENDNHIYAHDTLEFVAVAAQYCAVLEQEKMPSRQEFIDMMLKLLPMLYTKVTLLAHVEPYAGMAPNNQVTDRDYAYVQGNVMDVLGEMDSYEALGNDPTGQTDEVVWHSCSEDLADIYRPLRNFVHAYQLRLEPMMEAELWNVRENFEMYWGMNLINALSHLHRLRYD